MRQLLLLTSLLAIGAIAVQAQPPSVTTTTLPEAAKAAATLPQLHSLLVSWRGTVMLEYYAKGRSATRLANIKSASKSVISTLVGIAIERRLIDNVDVPIVTYFPELKRSTDPRRQQITVEDLLTMRAGLEPTSGQNYGSWVRSQNWVRYVLERPVVSDPGTAMEYSTGSSHLLSAILTKVTKTNTLTFAQNTLATPLGFTLARWQRDPQGIYFGGNEMQMTPRQMLAFGELYLNGGRAKGKQIVSRAWVETSCVPRTTSRWNPDRHYGYGWWTTEIGGHQTCFAWGYGGQYILFFRNLGLVVVATSSPNVSDERFGHRRQLFDLIEQHIVKALPNPAVAAGGGATAP